MQVAAGDILCDIETDKATIDFESLEDGYEILIFQGSAVLMCFIKYCIILSLAIVKILFVVLLYEMFVLSLAVVVCRVLVKILMPSGSKDVPVGKPLCVIVSLH